MKKRAVFLDRDGTIIHGDPPEWITCPGDVRLLNGAAAAVRAMNRAGFVVVVLTNQSGVARGYFTEEDLAAIDSVMLDRLRRAGAHIDAVYFCPHHPEAKLARYRKVCDCRKPKKGMLRRAVRDLGLTLKGSFMVGDATRDVLLAKDEAMTPILVRTGKGRSLEKEARAALGERLVVTKDLAAAARIIVESR